MGYRLKILFPAIFTLIATSTGIAAEKNEPTLNEQAAASAKAMLERATVYLSKRIEECEDVSQTIDLEAFRDLELSDAQILVTLTYFHQKAHNRCVDTAAKDFLAASRTFSYARSSVPELDSPDIEFRILIDHIWWQELKAEAMYEAAVAADIRTQIEDFEVLQTPFVFPHFFEQE